MADAEDGAFAAIVEAVGNDGKFQRRFNFLFNFLLVVGAAMPYGNIIIALAIPDHWCFVPGRENTSFSSEEWKRMHIPRDNESLAYSNCHMYDKSNESGAVECRHGWEFDRTWYGSTAPSQESWVCDDAMHVANAFVFARLGEMVGIFCFGQLADVIGRKPVFLMAVVTTVLGRMLSIATSHSLPLFFLTVFIGNLSSTSLSQGPYVIAIEMTKSENRAKIAMMQSMGWTLGFCLLPITMWLVEDWYYFIAITTVPCLLFLFCGKFLIESPRWLLSKRKTKRCLREFERMAKVNGTQVPGGALRDLVGITGKRERVYGMLSLFSSWRLAKNTLLLMAGWSATITIYDTLTLNVNNLGVNPFVSYFGQGFSELPGYILGKVAGDKFGRRWTHIAAFAGTFSGCVAILFIIHDKSQQTTVAAICVYLKFCIAFAYYVINLEAVEVYPTCLRQTGVAIGVIVGNAFGMLVPYLVHTATVVGPSLLYAASAGLCLIGGLCGLFLPETLNQELPETLAEAAIFGADQSFFGESRKSVPQTEAQHPLSP